MKNSLKDTTEKKQSHNQRVLVFQQNGSGESKIKGVRKFGGDLVDLEIISIDETLPSIIEDSRAYFPSDIQADIVLDFLKHPDLSSDLSELCFKKKIPVIASGKKMPEKQALTPPT